MRCRNMLDLKLKQRTYGVDLGCKCALETRQTVQMVLAMTLKLSTSDQIHACKHEAGLTLLWYLYSYLSRYQRREEVLA